jgi:toxin YoeB
MLIKFSSNAWEDYIYWQTTDRTILKRINQLIKDIERDPFVGTGKPEPLALMDRISALTKLFPVRKIQEKTSNLLKHHLTGFWSRRIDLQHRLVYSFHEDTLLIAQCRDHY